MTFPTGNLRDMAKADADAKKAAIEMGQRLREARIAAGYVESETGRKNGGVTRLAKEAGVSAGSISRIEAGDRTVDRVSRETLAKICERIGKDPEWIRVKAEPKDAARDLRMFLEHHVDDRGLREEIERDPYAFTLREIDLADKNQSHKEELKHLTPRNRLFAARLIMSKRGGDDDVGDIESRITDPPDRPSSK